MWDANHVHICCPRALWNQKKQEEEEILSRDVEEMKAIGRKKMFGRYVIYHLSYMLYVIYLVSVCCPLINETECNLISFSLLTNKTKCI